MSDETRRDEREARSSRLDDLYRRHADASVRLAYLLTGDRELAEDLMQEAFVKVARHLGHLRNPDGFEAYLRRTVVNLANSQFRRRRLERTHLERERSLARPNQAADERVEDRDSLRGALMALPVRQRSAIALRYYLDLPEAEIADLLGCRVGAVKALLHRGLDSLRAGVAP